MKENGVISIKNITGSNIGGDFINLNGECILTAKCGCLREGHYENEQKPYTTIVKACREHADNKGE